MFTLNGIPVTIPKELAQVSLLSFIRDHLRQTGTKYGCGQGLCGACTLHVNGKARRACQLTPQEVSGQAVTTIEGLADQYEGADLHPVQQAWIAERVPQCGYCQAGQIMTAAALLAENPAPGEQDIRDGMDGNLCRCGTYPRIHRAVARAARSFSSPHSEVK
ncbi:(2Fe-2S)-binding protein [Rhodovibrionaceae bacterium A322]